MTMGDKKRSARHIDAASIVGEDLAEELETKSQELVGRTGPQSDPAALVLKDAKDFPPASEEEGGDMATGTASEQDTAEGEPAKAHYGGAVTLSDAEAFLVRERGEDALLGDWDMLASVLINVAGEEHGPAIQKQLRDFQSRLDIMAVKALANLQAKEASMDKANDATEDQVESVAGDPEAEAQPEGHVLDEAMLELRTAFDEALETPVDANSRLRMIQPAMKTLGDAIMSTVNAKRDSDSPAASTAGGFSLEQLQAVVAAAVAPLSAEIEALKTKAVADVPRIPARRARVVGGVRPSFSGSVPGATMRIADEMESADAMRGVGAAYGHPSQINILNDTTPASETPKLNAMIRRSVGLG